uniref:Abnormal cell migration protein 18-like fibronectin type I domain-containing protein n=1 Tax=Trichuris muris TaxID=70415 RepID=A0A5S6QLW2_TRIMR
MNFIDEYKSVAFRTHRVPPSAVKQLNICSIISRLCDIGISTHTTLTHSAFERANVRSFALACFRMPASSQQPERKVSSVYIVLGQPNRESQQPVRRTEDRERAAAGGCNLDSGIHLYFGETYRTDKFVLKCERVNSTTARVAPVKCILDGTEMGVGDRKRKQGFAYDCNRRDDRLTLSIGGCFSDDDVFAEFGETFDNHGFTYKCVKEGDSVVHSPVGCIINGERAKVGETVTVGNRVYRCSVPGATDVRTEATDCMDSSGGKVSVGRRYRDGSFLYLCKPLPSGGSRTVLAGCVAKQNDSSLSYRMRCSGDENRVIADITHCIAKTEQGRHVIAVGESVQLMDKVITCQRQNDGTVVGKISPKKII